MLSEKHTRSQVLYRHFDKDGVLLYVGVSGRLMRRLKEHHQNASWFSRIARVDVEHYPDRQSVLKAEIEAIQREKPLFNKQFANRQRATYVKKIVSVRGTPAFKRLQKEANKDDPPWDRAYAPEDAPLFDDMADSKWLQGHQVSSALGLPHATLRYMADEFAFPPYKPTSDRTCMWRVGEVRSWFASGGKELIDQAVVTEVTVC